MTRLKLVRSTSILLIFSLIFSLFTVPIAPVGASTSDPTLDELGEADGSFELTIMHTNDTHAHLDNVPRKITAIEQVRQEAENAILLDAGDVFSGTLFFNMYLGMADLEFMNMAGYDAMVPGNHEFDKDSETLANFIREAEFPFVSANIDYSADSELGPLFNKDEIGNPGENGRLYPAIIIDVDGEQVGVFGLTTEDTTFLANPSDELIFEDRIEKAQETVDMLQAEGVNKIIALTHIGHNHDLALAEAVEGIDIVVGGHSHTRVEPPIVLNEDTEPTIVVQANEYSNYLGNLEVVFDEDGVLEEWNGELIDLNEQDADGNYVIEDDPEAAERLAELAEPIEELKRQVVGESAAFLNGERDDVRSKETNLGNLIADGMLAKAQESVDATIAITNGGGIRASIDEGAITLGDVLTTMPFGNTLVTLDLTGAEIIESLEHGVGGVENREGRFPQVAGLKFAYNPSLPVGERVVEVHVLDADGNDELLDPDGMYTVATNAFMADGGDGYAAMRRAKDDGRITEQGFVDYEVFVEHLEREGIVSPEVEGRIVETDREPGDGEDTTAPETTITLLEPQLTDGSYVHEVTFELTATDDQSGVEKIEYRFDEGDTWHVYDGPVTVSEDGETIIQYRAVDKAGNVEEAKTESVVVITASLDNVRTMINEMDAHISVKMTTRAQLNVAERFFDRGRAHLGYQQLAVLKRIVSKYNDRKINPDDKLDLMVMLDYMIEHRTAH